MKQGEPALDAALSSRLGSTRNGQPLSFNRAPSADIAPWVGRLYAAVVDMPQNYRLACGLFYDAPVVRVQLRGDWNAETTDGARAMGRSALMFGAQTRYMPVSVVGSFISVGFSLRPGTGHALFGWKARDYLDRFVHCDEIGLPGAQILGQLDQLDDPEAWLQTVESTIRIMIERMGSTPPDPITARFEMAALIDPNFAVADFAEVCGIPQRRLERIVTRDFGMSPKQVLRRSRALDMAAQLRGVGDSAEAEELLLRFYDQSHLIREFTALFGMAPSQIMTLPHPILTLALESRQARRLESSARLAPGEKRPWE